MDDDELEQEDTPAEQPKVTKISSVSNKLEDIPRGKSDCYWCGKVYDISAMRKQKSHNSIVWVCNDCG